MNKSFNSDKYKKKFFLIIISIFLSYFLLYIISIHDSYENKKDLIALGNQNKETFAEYNGQPIHCMDLSDLDLCINTLEKYNNTNILWLGNSQLHAINQKKENDKNAPEILFEKLILEKNFLLTLSQPNANLQEHYLLFEYIISIKKIDILILPIVFDDLRENKIRGSLIDILSKDNVYRKIISTKIGNKIINENIQKKKNLNIKTSTRNPQEITEEFLNTKLSEFSKVWDNRDNLRVKFLQNLRKLRNFIFNINAQSTRKTIPQRYEDNILALKQIIQSSKNNNIKLFLYIPPLRNDVKIPYDINEYNNFKKDMHTLARNEELLLFDFESIIPPEYWGFKNFSSFKELDFMHFRQKGHNILSDKLYQKLSENFILKR